MKTEYDFSKGERGKFYRADAELNIPVYLDRDIATAVQHHARQKKVNVGVLVNQWLRRDLKSMSPSSKQKTR